MENAQWRIIRCAFFVSIFRSKIGSFLYNRTILPLNRTILHLNRTVFSPRFDFPMRQIITPRAPGCSKSLCRPWSRPSFPSSFPSAIPILPLTVNCYTRDPTGNCYICDSRSPVLISSHKRRGTLYAQETGPPTEPDERVNQKERRSFMNEPGRCLRPR